MESQAAETRKARSPVEIQQGSPAWGPPALSGLTLIPLIGAWVSLGNTGTALPLVRGQDAQGQRDPVGPASPKGCDFSKYECLDSGNEEILPIVVISSFQDSGWCHQLSPPKGSRESNNHEATRPRFCRLYPESITILAGGRLIQIEDTQPHAFERKAHPVLKKGEQ